MQVTTKEAKQERKTPTDPGRDTLLIRPIGSRLGLDDMPEIYREFQALLRSHPRILRIDLREVERLAAGYAALFLRMKALAESQGTQLVLANVPAQLHAIFRIYKLKDAFGVQETTEHINVGKTGKEGAL